MPPAPPAPQRVLVVDPDVARGTAIEGCLRAAGVDLRLTCTPDQGWREFGRAPSQVVIVGVNDRDGGASSFLHHLQTEYMGTPPAVYLLCEQDQLGAWLGKLEADAVLVPPLPLAGLVALLRPQRQQPDQASLQATRLRELFDLSLLSEDFDHAAPSLLDRIALTFRVANCAMWGPAGDDSWSWPQLGRPIDEAQREQLLLACTHAIAAGSPLLWAAPPEPGTLLTEAPARMLLGVPMSPPGIDDALGALCLVAEEVRRFQPGEREGLRALARRLATELSWVSAHRRLIAEHERLRESALLDPLLGVWGRTAFEDGVASEIAAARRRGEPLTLAVFDVDQLRHLNDRHGHLAGDAILTQLAQALRRTTRAQDLVGRVGGDEIGVLLVGLSPNIAAAVVGKLLDSARACGIRQHGLDITVQVTAGITGFRAEEHDLGPALRRAMAAVSRARRGRQPLASTELDTLDAEAAEDDALEGGFALPAGSTLGGMYRILHEISRGAMGVVYRAEDLGLNRQVAIKVLRSDLARDEALVANFRREAATLAALRHRNLVQVYSFGSQGEDVYFVMELVEGEPLSDVLARYEEGESSPTEIDPEVVCKVAREIGDALDVMHNAGLIHRDVKPANVLLDRINDRAVLVDVGVAKRHDDRTDAAGTPGFAAPESFMDVSETPATDVYGLAATLYMMLTGMAPFGCGEVMTVLNRQLSERAAPPSQLRPDLPAAIDVVLLKALDPDPMHRFGSASAFAIALTHAMRMAPPRPREGASRPTTDFDAVPLVIEEREDTNPIAVPPPPSRPPPPRVTRPTVAIDPAPGRESAARLASTQIRKRQQVPRCRAVIFRVAYRFLGSKLGASWLQRISNEHAELERVLSPSLPPASWEPTDLLDLLLTRAAEELPEPGRLARGLGRATMSATFLRFYGADPTSMAPGAVLRAAETYWPRYLDWGRVALSRFQASQVVLVVHGSLNKPNICSFVEGAFGRIAELAGGRNVGTAHPVCGARGHATCEFAIRWERRTESLIVPTEVPM